MICQHSNSMYQVFILAYYCASVSICAEILTWIETKACRICQRSDALTAPPRAMGLSRILNHFQSVKPGDFHNPVDFAGLTVEVHGDYCASTRHDGGFNCLRIHQHRVWFYINKHWTGSSRRDRFRGGNKGVRCGNDFIPGPNSHRSKREVKSVCAVPDSNAGSRLAVLREFQFEVPNLFSADESATCNCLFDRGIDFRFDSQILCVQINQGHLHMFVLCLEYADSFDTSLITRAGLPTTTAPAGTSRVITDPAPTKANAPMRIPGKTVVFAPIFAPFSM